MLAVHMKPPHEISEIHPYSQVLPESQVDLAPMNPTGQKPLASGADMELLEQGSGAGDVGIAAPQDAMISGIEQQQGSGSHFIVS